VNDCFSNSSARAGLDDVQATSSMCGNAEVLGTHGRPSRLTARQSEILLLISEGLPTKLISRRLNITAGTVKVHISAILRELGVANRLQAVLTAQRCGLLNPVGMQQPR
jgi:DNA-binding NarL/FixJ family response regulator